MIEPATQVLKTLARRMLNRLAFRLAHNPSLQAAEEIITSFTKPWAEVYAYLRLGTFAEGMVDEWDDLKFDLSDEDIEHLQSEVAAIHAIDPETAEYILSEFEPQEKLLVAPWFNLPPPMPPGELTLTENDDIFGLRLPSYEWALQDLAKRRLVTRDEWDELEDSEISQAFTVAGLQTEGAIARVRDVLSNTLAEGWTLAEFKDAAGIQSFLSEEHAETVFRTNLHGSYSDGRLALLEHPLVSDAFPYATLDPIIDDRVRPEHKRLASTGINGTNVYRIDDPVFLTFRPPWDYNCRCGWGNLTIRQAAGRGVTEAKDWLASGRPPQDPERVPWPSYDGKLIFPSPSFRRRIAA